MPRHKYQHVPYNDTARRSKRYYWLILALVTILIIAGTIWFALASPIQNNSNTDYKLHDSSPKVEQKTKTDKSQTTTDHTDPATGKKIQAILDKWDTSHTGESWGVVIRGIGSSIWQAGLNADKVFNSDSLYKLFVAYLGYQKIDDGTFELSEPYLAGWSRGRCLDEMIRNSNSPCAEKLMNELGKPAIQAMADSYKLNCTSIAGFTTCPKDIASLFERLQAGQDLSKKSTKLFMASLFGEKYRNGLPTGFAPWKVYDKVGFAGYDEYHDAGIIKLPDGRQIIVVMMTRNASSRLIAELSKEIVAALQ